jgi:hypothetical protein
MTAGSHTLRPGGDQGRLPAPRCRFEIGIQEFWRRIDGPHQVQREVDRSALQMITMAYHMPERLPGRCRKSRRELLAASFVANRYREIVRRMTCTPAHLIDNYKVINSRTSKGMTNW